MRNYDIYLKQFKTAVAENFKTIQEKSGALVISLVDEASGLLSDADKTQLKNK